MKPGYRTTEFWSHLLIQMGALAVAFGWLTPAKAQAINDSAPIVVQGVVEIAKAAIGIVASVWSASQYHSRRNERKAAEGSEPDAGGHAPRRGRKAAAVATVTACLALFWVAPVLAGHTYPEKHYQQIWCIEQGGQLEVVLPDQSRCDCLTATHAVEFDFAPKWAEAVGQALNYARQTGRRAGVVLIIENHQAMVGVERIRAIAEQYQLPLDVWTVEE